MARKFEIPARVAVAAVLLVALAQLSTSDRISDFNNFVHDCIQSHRSPPFQNAKIAVKEAPGMGRGTFATANINSGEVYMFMPWKCIMSDDKARNELGAHRVQHLDDFHVLLLFLLREKSKGASSFFSRYISILPTEHNVPYFFSEQELTHFKGSYMVEAVEKERRRIQLEYQRLQSQLFPKFADFFTPASAYSFAQYEWATFTLNSRTIWATNSDGKRALIPLLDNVNCKEGPDRSKVHTSTRDRQLDAVITRAAWNFNRGEQVFENYASDNHVNMFYHGFVLQENSHDCVNLVITSSQYFCVSKSKLTHQLWDALKGAVSRSPTQQTPVQFLRELINAKLKEYKTSRKQDKMLASSYVVPERIQAAHQFLYEEKRILEELLSALPQM